MVNKAILIAAMSLIYYNISGLATTNILRLTAGNTLPVLSSKCVCDACGSKISAVDQLPIISYLICRGKCRNCGAAIPLFPLILEIAVTVGMIAITGLFRMSCLGILFSFLYYEAVRVTVIFLKGRRAEQFVKQYIISVLIMLPYLLVSLWVALLYAIVP